MSRIIRSPLRSLFLVSLILPLLIACGGTKVYDSSKTIVYDGAIYQVTDVNTISTRIQGRTSAGEEINLKNRERGDIEDLLEANDPLYVRMSFQLDDEELLYSAGDVDSWRDYSRLKSRFEEAGKDIAKLMAEKKTKQLKLR